MILPAALAELVSERRSVQRTTGGAGSGGGGSGNGAYICIGDAIYGNYLLSVTTK